MKGIMQEISDRLWWIALWLFIIMLNSCDIKEKIDTLIK